MVHIDQGTFVKHHR